MLQRAAAAQAAPPQGRPAPPEGYHWRGELRRLGGGGAFTLLHPAVRWPYPGQTLFDTYADCYEKIDPTTLRCSLTGCRDDERFKKITPGDFTNFGKHLTRSHKSELAYGHEVKWAKREREGAEGESTASASGAGAPGAQMTLVGAGGFLAAAGAGSSGQMQLVTVQQRERVLKEAQGRIRIATGKLILHHGQPFTITDDEAFRETAIIMAGVPVEDQDKLKLPSRRTITRDCDIVVKQEDLEDAQLVKQIIKHRGKKALSVAVDAWTRAGNLAYTGVTGYMMNASWQIVEFVIACDQMAKVDHS